MKRSAYSAGVLCVFCYLMMPVVQAQTVDIMEYIRFDNPPEYYEFIKENSGEVSPNRIVYTNEVDYHGESVLKIDRYEDDENPEQSSNTLYVDHDQENFYFVGFSFEHSTFGLINLPFDPKIPFPRSAEIGQTLEETTQASVTLGFLTVDVTVNATVELAGLETVEVPLGVFENALRLEMNLAAFLDDTELSSTVRTEWYHPSVGLVKTIDHDSENVYLLSRVEPPLVSSITSWELHQ